MIYLTFPSLKHEYSCNYSQYNMLFNYWNRVLTGYIPCVCEWAYMVLGVILYVTCPSKFLTTSKRQRCLHLNRSNIMHTLIIYLKYMFWRYLTRGGGLIWHLSQYFIRPSIYFSSIVISRSNPFLEPPILSNKGNNGGLWWGLNPRLPYSESDVQPTASRRPLLKLSSSIILT